MKKIGIIGGGASGMMAAIAASKKGASVMILEKQDRIGKKILATGNGKCNLSNLSFSAQRDYHSRDKEKLEKYFDRFCVQDTISFFEECGLMITDKNGYLYPRSGQAATVLNLFLEQLEKYQVKVQTECVVESVSHTKKGYLVKTNKEEYYFDELILSAGSSAGTKEKDKLGGMQLIKELQIKADPMLPALTAIRCSGEQWKAMAGVRCDGEITVILQDKQGKTQTFRERGELQLTEYGISGIPTFQLSRHVSKALQQHNKKEAYLDFMPELSWQEWKLVFEKQVKRSTGRNVLSFTEGMINKKVAQVLLKEAGIRNTELICYPMNDSAKKLMQLFKKYPIAIKETNPVFVSQVCAGGVYLSELDENLQVKAHQGLYVTGELADVDGRCGGYNLQWAWTSGWIAGNAAAEAIHHKMTTDRKKK